MGREEGRGSGFFFTLAQVTIRSATRRSSFACVLCVGSGVCESLISLFVYIKPIN